MGGLGPAGLSSRGEVWGGLRGLVSSLKIPEVRVGELGGAGSLGQDSALGGRVNARVEADGLAVGGAQTLEV